MEIQVSHDFDAFLVGLQDEMRVKTIENAIIDFVEGKLDLDPKACVHIENRTKVAIPDANVVVYFDVKDDTMTMISGKVMYDRAA